MSHVTNCSAFQGERRIASGPALDVALAVKAAEGEAEAPILVFDDATGRAVDFDLRGSDEEIAQRLGAGNAPRSPGRPKLGVVAREITLLPRHWEWLAEQPSGPSATLRRLVEAARAAHPDRQARRAAQEASDRFMQATLGNRRGYEDAARALYAGDRDGFEGLTADWPSELRDHARRLAEPAFTAPPSGG